MTFIPVKNHQNKRIWNAPKKIRPVIKTGLIGKDGFENPT